VLIKVLQDPTLRAGMVVAGHERVQMYDWSRISREVLDVYESVMAADIGVREDLRGQLVGRFARFMEL
jgi:hypothetical protein